jgi:hypothetical protein
MQKDNCKLEIFWISGTTKGSAITPPWEVIEEKINSTYLLDGSVSLSFYPTPKVGPVELSARCERGFFFVTLLEHFADKFPEIRTYFDPKKSTNQVQVGIDTYSERELIRDPKIVIAIFQEFFDTGNVSTDLLSL